MRPCPFPPFLAPGTRCLASLLVSVVAAGCSCTVTTTDLDRNDDRAADGATSAPSATDAATADGADSAAPSDPAATDSGVKRGDASSGLGAIINRGPRDGGEADAAADAGPPSANDSPDADAPLDKTAPLITLAGAPALKLDCGELFQEPGVSALDDTDGPLPVETAGVAGLSTAAPGHFELDYSATDAAGNTGNARRTVTVCGPSCGDLGKEPVDLRLFTPIQYEFGYQSDASWDLTGDGFSVTQSINADGSLFLSEFDTKDLSVEGLWLAGSSSDDDFMGFVFGYQDPGHYYLFDWKGGSQTHRGERATVGMSLKIVDFGDLVETDGSYVVSEADFWSDEGSENVRPMTQNGLPIRNTIPWQTNVEYSFFLEAHAGSFRISVATADGELESWGGVDTTYEGGQFGFYNYSQGPVDYASFTARETPPLCSTVDVQAASATDAGAGDAGG